MIKEDFCDGKYTVIFDDAADKAEFKALRYGEEWRDLTGDGLVLSMLQEVEDLHKIISEVHAWAVCGAIASPEDIAQNLPRIIEITSSNFKS